MTDSFVETLISIKVLCIEYLNAFDNDYKEKIRVLIRKHIDVWFSLICVNPNCKYTLTDHV